MMMIMKLMMMKCKFDNKTIYNPGSLEKLYDTVQKQ